MMMIGLLRHAFIMWYSKYVMWKVSSVRYNNLFYCYSFCKNILKYLSRMARVSLRTAERSMFLPLRTVSDASGLCKCIIKVQLVVYELTVNNYNNNNDIFIHFLQRKIFNLQCTVCLYTLYTLTPVYISVYCFFWHALDCLFIPPLFV